MIATILTIKLPSWVKVVITCRSDSWQRSLKYSLPAHAQTSFFGFDKTGEPIEIPRFSTAEAGRAYDEKYCLSPQFSMLSTSLQNLLTDPLMLGLAYRVYRDRELPPDLHQNRILRTYKQSLLPESADGYSREEKFLDELVREMYLRKKTELSLDEIRQNSVLQEAFASPTLLPSNPYVQLVSDLLRESASKATVTFRYERVFEFLLAELVLKKRQRKTIGQQNGSCRYWKAQRHTPRFGGLLDRY